LITVCNRYKTFIFSIIEDFGGDLIYPENFEQTVDVYNPSERNPPAAKVMVNPQSTLLCTMLSFILTPSDRILSSALLDERKLKL
jgi:hypothetical protein